MKGLAIVIKTFIREAPLFRLVASIKEKLPDATMFIADDSATYSEEKAKLYQQLKEEGHKIITLPYDVGISAGRNAAVKKVPKKFKYVLLCDDDFVIIDQFDPSKAITILEGDPTIGVVGGSLLDDAGNMSHYEWDLKIEGKTIYKLSPSSPEQEVSGVKYRLVDLTLNFWIARREIFDEITWDDKLTVSTEHMDFFMALKWKSKWKVAYCQSLVAGHYRVHDADKKYWRLRYRKSHWLHFAKKWKIEEVDEFGEKLNYITEAHKWDDYEKTHPEE